MTPSANMGMGLVANTTFVLEGCDDLPAHKTDDYLISCWRLTFWERLQVLFGGRVYLFVAGDAQPPVMLETDISVDKLEA